MTASLKFHTEPLTLGEAVQIQRLKRDPMDMEAVIALLAARSHQSIETICALPLTDLTDLLPQLAAALKVVNVLATMTLHWDDGTLGPGESE